MRNSFVLFSHFGSNKILCFQSLWHPIVPNKPKICINCFWPPGDVQQAVNTTWHTPDILGSLGEQVTYGQVQVQVWMWFDALTSEILCRTGVLGNVSPCMCMYPGSGSLITRTCCLIGTLYSKLHDWAILLVRLVDFTFKLVNAKISAADLRGFKERECLKKWQNSFSYFAPKVLAPKDLYPWEFKGGGGVQIQFLSDILTIDMEILLHILVHFVFLSHWSKLQFSVWPLMIAVL